MELLPFGKLQPYKPRHFVPSDADLGDWDSVKPLFDQLDSQAAEAQTGQALETWLLHWGELQAALDEEASKRYIAMTCHTEDSDAERAYLHFLEHIDPQVKPRQFHLCELYLKHPCRERLPKERYAVFDRDIQLQVDLYRPENVPLETEEAKLGQQYQKLSGSLTVQFQGEERTLPQMARFLEEPDRSVRREAWELVAQRRIQEKERFESLFDELLGIREKIAANAGFSNYREYAFRARGRFDYGPEDCERFHQAIEEVVMPLVRDLHQSRQRRLNLSELRPWDLAVDPTGRPPLEPFREVDDLVNGTQRIFELLDPELASGFRNMREQRLLDLKNRKGKAPGGYQSTLAEARLPFIFMNSVGIHRDVETMLHEAGHAFHALATQTEDLYPYRSAPIEFCEVASMSMELLGNQHLEIFYDNEDATRARRQHLEGIIALLPWIATVDAFQHWVYTHPRHSPEDRRLAWSELMNRFGGAVLWDGHEEARDHLWHRQLHIFIHPFYYIEYGIAQLGALQVWANARTDQAKALASYRAALALGGSKPLPQLFQRAGCEFDFSARTVRPLMHSVQEELARMSKQD